jgi:hypothetical protein
MHDCPQGLPIEQWGHVGSLASEATLALLLEAVDRGASGTYVDLYLYQITPGERPQTLVVRGSITVPTEGKKINLPDSHAALIAIRLSAPERTPLLSPSRSNALVYRVTAW